MALKRPDISGTLRNRNYLWRGCGATVLAVAMLWLNLVSSWGLDWLGIGLQIVSIAAAAIAFLLWRRATLRVDDEAVHVGGLLRARVFSWSEVASFSIRDPVDRSLFVWTFARWKTQARLCLVDGESLRIRAVQPWPSNWTYDRPEEADRAIEALNDFRAARQSTAIDTP